MMKLIKYPPQNEWSEILKRPQLEYEQLRQKVSEILYDVKTNGDAAVKQYTQKFDDQTIDDLEVDEKTWEDAGSQISDALKQAIDQAIKNITVFHASQIEKTQTVETMPGVACWRKSVGIEKVGLYIPGGSAPLFSTLLMLAIPAKLAGCKEIIVSTPADKDGIIHPAILYAALKTGVNRIFKIGGVQAIGAMAYGTESVPKVYKIFGPGNQYVTCAKMLLSAEGIAIDIPAGPSELAVLADETCIPEYVAADLLSQAEHGPDSQVILVSPSEIVIKDVIECVESQLNTLPRKDIATKALHNSKAILVSDIEEGLRLVNEYAPEHLIICCNDEATLAEKVVNAGSVFLGNYSPESAGDYASGTNHTLPTNGFAKAYSGVSLDSFTKKITFQKLSSEGLRSLAPTIREMAGAEGLQAHANSVSIRLKNLNDERV